MIRKLIAVCLCALALAGCAEDETPRKTAGPPRKTILIGLIPEQNIFKQLERYQPLAAYLSRKTGTKVTLKILRRYGNIIDNFQAEGLDGAFFGSFTYAMAHAKLGVEVVARPVALDNTSTYHGLIFVRKDSGIKTFRDMKGKRFAYVDRATTAGYLLPQEYFYRQGISDCSTYLKECYFAGTHEDAIEDVVNRKADIGAAKNTVFDRLAKANPRIRSELTVLTKSPDVPENGLALRKDIDESLRSRLKDALLTMHLDPEGRNVLEQFEARRFIETTNEDYRVVVQYAKALGLNLATYEYRND